jgi:hypothetical protein
MGGVIRVMPKVARDWLEFEESVDQESGEARYDINGTKAHLLFKSWALSRMFSTAESFNRLLEAEGMGSAVLDLVTGLEFREFDMTEKQRSHLRARIKRLENELKRKGKVRSFERTFVPKGTPLKEKLDAIKEERKGGGFFG